MEWDLAHGKGIDDHLASVGPEAVLNEIAIASPVRVCRRVNRSSYLRDDSGGRRFWPVACGRVDIDSLVRDRDQLWTEANARFEHGSAWWLATAELVGIAAGEQADCYEGDPWEDVIGRWAEDRSSISISDVLARCLDKPQGL